jgi:DNA processing protein
MAQLETSLSTLEILGLLQLSGIGPATVRKILASMRPCESVEDAARRAFGERLDGYGLIDKGRTVSSECERYAVDVIGLEDEAYPSSLKVIRDAPPVLYLNGKLSALSPRSVAVVGTRNASPDGRRNALHISRFLVGQGYTVVSGLARGIDTAAHLGAVEGGGATVAVLAHGLHTITPSANQELAKRVISKGGALLAEHPPGFPPLPQEFVRRNRIQSGLCLASIVVESGVDGGAMHHARFAREQGRGLLTVLSRSGESPSALDESGARILVEKMGAIAIHSVGELSRVLENIKPPSCPDSADTLRLF